MRGATIEFTNKRAGANRFEQAAIVGFGHYRTAYKLGHSVASFDDDAEDTKHQAMPLRNTQADDWRN